MRKVMICEDDPLLAADLAGLVEDAGHAVCGVFGESRQALSRAGELAPELAIIDLDLADGATGSEVARALQAMGVRVVILSGHSNVGQGLGCVPHTFAQKPVSREVVGQLLAIPG
jgi:DNA-binding NarL/FixJ family response regulator